MTVDEYIAGFSPDVQDLLQEIRSTIQAHAPEATETINYQIPTFKLNGNLVHFAGTKNHIGFYPAPSGISEFEEEFKKRGYKYSKGAVQFPINQPMPLDLVSRIVEFRVKEQS